MSRSLSRRLAAWLGALALGGAVLSPGALAADEYQIYLNSLNGLYIIDPATLGVVRTIAYKGISEGMVADEAGKRLYVLTGLRERIDVYDRAKGEIVQSFSFSEPGRTKARVLGYTVVNNRLFAYLNISRFDGWEDGKLDKFHLAAPKLVAVDLATSRKVGEAPMPFGVMFLQRAKDGQRIWAVGRNIDAIDTQTLKLTRVFNMDQPDMEGQGAIRPMAQWVHPEASGGLAAFPYTTVDPITEREMVGVLTLDTVTGQVDNMDLGPPVHEQSAFSVTVMPDRKRALFIFNQLAEVDLTKRRIARVVDPEVSYYAATVTPDGRQAFLTAAGPSLTEIDPVTLAIKKRVDLPSEVWDILILPKVGP